jgi:hypothetical protein
MCQLFCLAESSRHHHHLQDEAPTLIPEALQLRDFEADRPLGVGRHREAMADLREPISTHTDRGHYLDQDLPDNIEAPTEVAQDRIHPDHDLHREDVEAEAEEEDVIALAGMAQDGEVQATAVTVAMMIAAEAEVVGEEAEEGASTVRNTSLNLFLGLKASGVIRSISRWPFYSAAFTSDKSGNQ